MSGRHSRNKGKRGELEACRALELELPGLVARRGVQYSGDPTAPDVQTNYEGIHFEIKRTNKLRLYAAVEQAKNDCGESSPVVLHRADGGEWLAVIPLTGLGRFVTRMYLNMMNGGSDET